MVVLTRGERDLETLKALSKPKLRYVGMLASHQRAKDNLSRLRESGVDGRFLASLRCPVGADIGAVTPTEIALSIMTEVVAEKYGKDLPRKTPDPGVGDRKVEKQAG